MYRKAACLLFALVCITTPLAFASEDEELFDTPLFKVEEVSQPQRVLLASAGSPPSYPPTYPPTTCNSGTPYEVYFVALYGVQNRNKVPKWGLTRDRLWAPRLKLAAKGLGLPWKFPVTNYSRCVFQKTTPFSKQKFHARIVCNLTDVPCSKRPAVRNAFRNAAKYKSTAFCVVNKPSDLATCLMKLGITPPAQP